MKNRKSLQTAIIAITMLLSGSWCNAQTAATISGSITDQQKTPVSYATVLIFRNSDTVLLKSCLSDINGKFLFRDISAGTYKIKITSIGFQPYFLPAVEVTATDIVIPGPIILSVSEHMLKGVTISASRPFLEQKVDRLVVNVSNSVTSAGATGLEILQKVPGVIIINDHINLSGKTGVTIMIDGKSSPYTDMEAVLKDIPGSNIDKIEVISNPGAKFEASGSAGLINILLKKNNRSGLTGTYILGSGYSNYNQTSVASKDRSYYRYNASVALNYNSSKWQVFGNADFLHRYVFEVNNYDRRIGENNFFQKNYYPYFYNTINFRFGTNYEINKKSTIGILVTGNHRDGYGTSRTLTNIRKAVDNSSVDSFITDNLTKINRLSITANINYKYKIDTAGNLLNIDLDYSNYRYRNTEFIDIETPEGKIKNYQLGKNPLFYNTAKVDFIHPMGKSATLEVGAKYAHVNIDNDLLFSRNDIIDQSRTNVFNYKESVNAAYVNFNKKYKGTELQVGVRGEQTQTDGVLGDSAVLRKKYFQLFPSISLTQKFGADWGINIAFARRVDRPQFVLLSPFSYYVDSLTYSKGNPNLQPQLTNTSKLTINYKNSYFLSLSYNHTKNTIYENAPEQIGNVTYTQANNLGTHNNWVAGFNAPLTISKRISGYLDLEGIYNQYNAAYLNAVYNSNMLSFQTNATIDFSISDALKAECNYFYSSGTLNEFMRTSSFSGLNLGLQRSLFGKRAKLSLSANDIFYKNPTISTVKYASIDYHYFYRDDSRNFRLTFSYSFGKKSNEHVDREIGSKDENNRLNN